MTITLLMFCLLVLVTMKATASSTRQSQIHQQQRRYWHATGYQRVLARLPLPAPVDRHDRIVRGRRLEAITWLRQVRRDARRRIRALQTPPPPAHYQAWMCVHSHEGAWDANTGNGYYGGLQMDYEFMSAYGPELLHAKGTADHWTPIEQMWVAERAYRTRGFNPWPNTARACGLL